MSENPEKPDLKRSAPEQDEEAPAEETESTENGEDAEDGGWIGPMPSEQSAPAPAKKKKGKQNLER